MARLTSLICGALALLGAFAAPGCGREASQAANGPAIWRLTDADSEIWLFGTAHMLPSDLAWNSAKADAALAAADTVMFETPIDEAGQKDIAALAVQFGRNPPGVTLSSLLTPADQDALKRACAKTHVDAAALEGTRPWLAGVGLSVSYVVSKGLDPKSGVERVLEAKASQAGKKRDYFETGEEQIRFFADLPIATQVEFLRATIKEIETEDEDFIAINRAWARGDVKTLRRYFAAMNKDTSPAVYDALIRNRNRVWVERIAKMMAGSGKTFIAVGAAHLIGDGSVIEMLRQKGYKVEGP